MKYYHLLKISDEIINEYFEELTKIGIKRKNKLYRLNINKLSGLSLNNINIDNVKRAVFMRYGGNYFTIVDRISAMKIRKYKWRPGTGSIIVRKGECDYKENVYVFTGGNLKLHRFILKPSRDVHHNENSFDNRLRKGLYQSKIIDVDKPTHRQIHKYQGKRNDELVINDLEGLKTLLSYI